MNTKLLDLVQIAIILLILVTLVLLFLGRRRLHQRSLLVLLGAAVLAEALHLGLPLFFPH